MIEMTVTDPSHPSHLVAELQAMRRDGELFDFVITGNEKSFHIHSLVLASFSPMFKALLRCVMDESSQKEATFPSIPDDILSMVIDFAYNGTCTFSGDELMELVKAADYLQMSKLLKLCEYHVPTVLQPSNCISWLLLADRLHLTDFVTPTQTMMRTSFQEVVQSEDFNYLEMSELVQYLSDVREHGIHSDVFLDGALEWVKHNTQNRAVHMQELFSLVHVSECSERVLSQMIAENGELLGAEGVYRHLLCEVLMDRKSKVFGTKKTILTLCGESLSNCPNTDCLILQNDKLEKYCEAGTGQVIQPGHSICEIPGGLMLTGGTRSVLCMVFICPMKLWVKQNRLLSARSYHASGYVRGKVVIVGGKIPLESVDFMDMTTKRWRKGPALPGAERYPKVVTCGSILFVLLTQGCNLYQLGTDKMSWSSKSPLPQDSFGCSLAASEDKMFAAGGCSNINCVYTPTTDTWCCLTGPSLEDAFGSLVYHHQKLYLVAGCLRDKVLTDVEEYDMETDKWTLTEWKLPKPLWHHHAFLVDVPQV